MTADSNQAIAGYKLVNIRGEPIGGLGEPSPRVIEHLELLLEKAKTGEIVGIAYAVNNADRSVGWNWCGSLRNVTIIGALAGAQYEMTRRLVDED